MHNVMLDIHIQSEMITTVELTHLPLHSDRGVVCVCVEKT